MSKSNHKKTNQVSKLLLAVPVLLVLVIALVIFTKKDNTPTTASNTSGRETVVDQDLVIPVSELSKETAQFYPVEVNGTKMEIIAVKASDDSIRTAFNTCQVCYSSGRGYYKQEGNTLVCQNCGNRFSMDQVDVEKGGCNPVPISSDQRNVTDSEVTISKDYMQQATVIFSNWKN